MRRRDEPRFLAELEAHFERAMRRLVREIAPRRTVVRCHGPDCPRSAILYGHEVISRGLVVGILQRAACQTPYFVGEVAVILPSVILRCSRHGFLRIYHPREAGEMMPGRGMEPRLVVKRASLVECRDCRVVPRLRLELAPRQLVGGAERPEPPALGGDYTMVT